MSQFWLDLWSNKVLVSALAGWLTAQIAKTIVNALINKQWSWERLVGSGGMPSSHAATVCALAVAALLTYGVGSFEFAIALILAIVVLHDARGVRLETGRQAAILNQIIHKLAEGEKNPFQDVHLKELVGHTPSQVVVGSLLGIIVAVIVC